MNRKYNQLQKEIVNLQEFVAANVGMTLSLPLLSLATMHTQSASLTWPCMSGGGSDVTRAVLDLRLTRLYTTSTPRPCHIHIHHSSWELADYNTVCCVHFLKWFTLITVLSHHVKCLCSVWVF